MPSFKLFRIDENYNILNMEKEDVLNKIQVNKEDPLTEKKLVESLKKTHRNLSFSSEKTRNVIQSFSFVRLIEQDPTKCHQKSRQMNWQISLLYLMKSQDTQQLVSNTRQ